MSDREEALALAEYALSRYRACQSPSIMDRNDFQSLQKWIQKHK